MEELVISRTSLGIMRWIEMSFIAAFLIVAWTSVPAAAQAASQSTAPDADDAHGQNNPSTPAAKPAASIGMNDVVMTIKGFCPDRKNATDPCQTVITRQEFENLAVAIRPSMSASVKQQFANLYPKLLIMAQKAEEMGLDKQSPYEQMIVFSRMQILAQALSHKVQQDASVVSDQEVADYYARNADTFDMYTLQRLVVPLSKQGGSDSASAKNASELQFDELAKTLRARAAAGEDFLKLQKEAFDAAGIKVASTNVSMGTVRRTSLPAAHIPIIDGLKPGEVSQVIKDNGGHYIYKLESKEHPTLTQAETEIRHLLAAQHASEAVDKITSSYSIETNKNYFAVQPSLKPED
jgi:hypothetical protein